MGPPRREVLRQLQVRNSRSPGDVQAGRGHDPHGEDDVHERHWTERTPRVHEHREHPLMGMEQIVFTLIGGYEGTSFCKGLIVAYHGRNLAMKAYTEMPVMNFHSPFAALQ